MTESEERETKNSFAVDERGSTIEGLLVAVVVVAAAPSVSVSGVVVIVVVVSTLEDGINGEPEREEEEEEEEEEGFVFILCFCVGSKTSEVSIEIGGVRPSGREGTPIKWTPVWRRRERRGGRQLPMIYGLKPEQDG